MTVCKHVHVTVSGFVYNTDDSVNYKHMIWHSVWTTGISEKNTIPK